MESILVTVLIGCFLAAMVPAAIACLLDVDAVNRQAHVAPSPPPAPLAATTAFESDERMAA